MQTGNLLFRTRTLPPVGREAKFIGRVGADIDVPTGRKAAYLAVLNSSLSQPETQSASRGLSTSEMFLRASSWRPISAVCALRVMASMMSATSRIDLSAFQPEHNRVDLHRLTSHSGVGPFAAQWRSVPIIGPRPFLC